MATTHFSIGQQVIVDQRSEHYPGETVTVVDAMPGEEYGYCVSPTPNQFGNTGSDCEWVRTEDLRPLAPRKGAGDPFEVGDPVVAKDETNFTMLPEVGYVAEVDDGMIGIAYEQGKAPDILVSRRFVRHA